MRRGLLVLCIGVLSVAVLRGVFSSAGSRVTPDAAKRAFARVGLSHPTVQTTPPGVVFNYGRPPHLVSVSVFSGATPKVVFVRRNGMRVTRWANVMVFYSKNETAVVRRAATILGDRTFSSSAP